MSSYMLHILNYNIHALHLQLTFTVNNTLTSFCHREYAKYPLLALRH